MLFPQAPPCLRSKSESGRGEFVTISVPREVCKPTTRIPLWRASASRSEESESFLRQQQRKQDSAGGSLPVPSAEQVAAPRMFRLGQQQKEAFPPRLSLCHRQSDTDRHLAGLLCWGPAAEGLLGDSSRLHLADVRYEAQAELQSWPQIADYFLDLLEVSQTPTITRGHLAEMQGLQRCHCCARTAALPRQRQAQGTVSSAASGSPPDHRDSCTSPSLRTPSLL